MSHRGGALLLLAVLLTACAETYKIRPIQLDESAALTIAADPLLKQVGLIGPRRSCTMAVTLNDVQARVLEVLPGSGSEYCLGFYVSSGALALTFTVSVADPNCSVTSRRKVVATWTWIPDWTYFRNPDPSTINS